VRVVCDRVSRTYATAQGVVTALREVSLTVNESEFVCVVGPSGCGKTTLLRLVAGLLMPTAGSVTFVDRGDDPRPDTAFVFQQHGLFPWMTVVDNVGFGLRMRGVPRRECRARAADALAGVGLESFLYRFPHQLSGGMRQRVGIARAMITNPRVLLMDEPYAWVDALTKLALKQELVQTWTARGCGVLYVTHDIEEAVRLGDRIVVMTGGDGEGGAIREEFLIDVQRPRDLVGPLSPGATEIVRRVWAILEDDVRRRVAIAR
jgi:NitT/TauT family transport system ATP-binding protein